jgi:hypothetical protein
MKKFLIIAFGLILIVSVCCAATSQDYIREAENRFKKNGFTVYQQISTRVAANYFMLKAIYEEERQQTELLRQILNKK